MPQCVAMAHGKLQVSQTISFGCRHSPVNGRDVIMFSLQCLNMVVSCDDSLFQMENVQCQHYTNIISTIVEEQLASGVLNGQENREPKHYVSEGR